VENDRLKIYSNVAEAEKANARQAARRTYTERFYLLMDLIKVSAMISSAKKITNSDN
jgi:hypothetical protein